MAPSAFVLGGTGLIGRAVAPLLLEHGYEVTVGSRGRGELPAGVQHALVDRSNDDEFDRATRGDFDLFVDIVAYDQHHAEQLMRLQGRVESLVIVSSAAVYADPDGKTLLGSDLGSGEPIGESAPVVDPVPDGSDYAGGKVAVENIVLESDLSAAVLRPGAIFGPGDRASREWYFVKRVIDGREVAVLAYRGASKFHHVSSTNVAGMVLGAAATRATGVFNCGDPAPLDVHGICDAVGVAMGHELDVTDIDGPPRGSIGDTPWSIPRSFVLDLTTVRKALDFQPASYDAALRETCDWLADATAGRAWQEVLPAAARHYSELFDYAAEDEFLRGRSQ